MSLGIEQSPMVHLSSVEEVLVRERDESLDIFEHYRIGEALFSLKRLLQQSEYFVVAVSVDKKQSFDGSIVAWRGGLEPLEELSEEIDLLETVEGQFAEEGPKLS